MRLRLQFQLFIVMIVVLSALTVTSLLVVRHSVQNEVRRQTAEAVSGAVRAFDRLQRQQHLDLLRTAAMMAELPTLKAPMATAHAATIQDASAEFWALSGTDLLLLADNRGKAMAVHSSAGVSGEAAQHLLDTLGEYTEDSWWQDSTGLYRIVTRPIVAGSGKDQQLLGTLVLGLRINDAVAQQIGRLAGSDVVLGAGDSILATTLGAGERPNLMSQLNAATSGDDSVPHEVKIGNRPFEVSSIPLQTGSRTAVRGYMMVSLESTYAFLRRLNTTVLVLALVVAGLGAALLSLISSAITRPLDNLIAAVRALAAGDATYTLDRKGSVEVAELATAFVSMRRELTESQRRELEAERLAALGRAAGSISHDLRHHLAALVANAEFLHDSQDAGPDRDEMYREIQRASDQMTVLIDSLVEISREKRILVLSDDDLVLIVSRSADAVRGNPEHRQQQIRIESSVDTRGSFDVQKLERAFFNVLLNACEASGSTGGSVTVTISGSGETLECRISDTGTGVPEAIRGSLFEPFVSAGKNNGTGLGLTIASKILRDHEGEITVETTSASGTTFLVQLPRKFVGISPEPVRATAS